MFAMHMLCKTGTDCLRVADPHFIFDCICVRTIQTHMRRLIMADLALALNQLISFCPIPSIPPLLSWVDMKSNSTYGCTIDPDKQWVFLITGFIVRVNNNSPPPLCTPYHGPFLGFIYNLFSKRIVKIGFGFCQPSDALIYQLDIDHIHCKNRQVEPLRPIFSTQLFFMPRISWRHILCLSIWTHTM